MLQENNPDAACIYVWAGNDGETDKCCISYRFEIGNIGKYFAHHQLLVVKLTPTAVCKRLYTSTLLGRADFDFSFSENSDRYILDDMLAFANSLCFLVLSRSDRHVRTSLLCAELIALSYVWLRVRALLLCAGLVTLSYACSRCSPITWRLSELGVCITHEQKEAGANANVSYK